MIFKSLSSLCCVLLIGTFGLEHCSGSSLHNGHQLRSPSTKVIHGDKMVFIYQRSDNEYMFQAAEATDDIENRNIYNISRSEDSEFIISIQVSGGDHVFINSDDKLSTTTNESEAAAFIVSPIVGSDKFRLFDLSGTDGLVTPNGRPPFTFFLQRRYPDEPLAEFYWREVTVEETYVNERSNINDTLTLIQSSQNVDKAAAYAELLALMEINLHIEGAEIFSVAKYIAEDLGVDNEVFSSLPSIVQLLFQNVGLKFSYEEFPMKYSWASDVHENIRPYTFTRDESSGLWAITYSTNDQLTTGNMNPLVEIISDEKHFDFQLYFWPAENETPASLELLCYGSEDSQFYPIHTTDTVPDFYFQCGANTLGRSNFRLALADV